MYKNFRRKMIKSLYLAILVTLAISAGCQQDAQVTIASQEVAQQQKLFDYREITLKNGLRVVTLEDFSTPIAAVQLWYHVGSKNERPDRQGFAHMFEHMMFRGTDKLGPTEHSDFIRRTGGNSNGYTGFDRTVYLETLPADQLEMALWLEAERMAFLRIDKESFDIERKVVEEERRLKLNQPYGTTVEKVFAEIYKAHPYRWMPIGKISHLRASTVQELRNFWETYYVPNNAVLIIVGAVEHKKAQRLADKYFGWIPRYSEPAKIDVQEPQQTAARTATIKGENAPVPVVGIVYRTVPVGHKDMTPLDLLAEILGQGTSSRLYRELVAEKQLAVGVETASWSLEQDGLFGAGAAMAPAGADANTVLDIIQKHIEMLRTEAVSERELTKARNRMLKRIVSDMLTVETKARMLGSAATEQADTSAVNRYLQEIRDATAEDLQRVANQYLSDERGLVVTVERNLKAAEPTADESKSQTAPLKEQAEMSSKRTGLKRPKGFPEKAPIGQLRAHKFTPKYTKRVLENGLRVIVIENHEVPFVTAQLGVLHGAWAEAKPGTASVTMQMLTKGTANYTEAELADELETYGISLSGRGGMDNCSINASCLSEYSQKTLEMMAEVVLNPTFPEDEFEKLRKQVVTSLAVSAAEPDYIADRQLRRSLYGSHPYSRTVTGEVADVNILTADDAKKWWWQFARPDEAVLIFAGSVKEAEAFALAEEVFGGWKADAEAPEISLGQISQVEAMHIYLVDVPGSVQSQIRVAQMGITRHMQPEYFISRIVSNYFGWGFNSRLNKSVRVDKGLTYGIGGSYVASRFAGKFTVSTFSKTETTAQAVQAVLDEIERLVDEPPSAMELEDSKSYMAGVFVVQGETPQQVADHLWLIESQQLGSDYLDRLLATVAETRTEDCMDLVRDTIQPGKMIIVVVGDAEKLKGELEKIAPVTVVEN